MDNISDLKNNGGREPLSAETTSYISKEQFHKLCHISKATAQKLLKSGLVPAIDTHKPTNRYLIAQSDVEQYLRDREAFPERYSFSSEKNVNTYGNYAHYNLTVAQKMRMIAQNDWKNAADVLCADEVAKLLGYRVETIYRWCKRLGVTGYVISGQHFIPKRYLLDLVASKEF